MSRDLRHIYLVLNIAEMSNHYRYPMGAVITKGSRVLSFGTNKAKTHPLQKNPHTGNRGFIHAEFDALLKAPYIDYYNSQIYVVRLFKNGTFGKARPCKSCIELLLSHGIYIAIYSLEENKFIKEDLRTNKQISIIKI